MGDFMTDNSWIKEGRYIIFESLRKDNRYEDIYEIGSSRIREVSSEISPRQNQDEISEGEENFSTQVRAYLDMLNSMYIKMINDESAFFSSNLDAIDLTPFTNIKNIINKMSKSNSRLSEEEYQTLIAFTNAIQNSKSTDNEIAKNINNAYNNILQLKTNFDLLSEDKQIEEIYNYINNISRYRRNIAGNLMKSIKIDDTVLRRVTTTSVHYAQRINNVLKEISKLPEFQKFIVEQYELNLTENTIEIKGDELKQLILNIVANEVINNSSQIANQRATTIAKSVMQKITQKQYKLSDFGKEYSHVFSRKKKFKKKSIEEIALTTEENLAKILEAADNAEEILNKYEKYTNNNELTEAWKKLQNIVNTSNSKNKINQARTNFNNIFKSTISKLIFGNDTPFNELKKQIKNNPNLLNDKLATIEEDYLSFTKNAVTEMMPDFVNGCNLTISKNDISELLSAKMVDQLANLISGKVPGKINMKDDIRFILDLGHNNIQQMIEKELKKGSTSIIKQINDHVNDYINNTIDKFLQEYHDIGEGATNVAIAKETYINELKTLVAQTEEYLNSINANEEQRKIAWNKINNTLVGAISVKDYTLYNDELGYHGGSLGSSGAPEGVINNINEMYETGGITPVDKEKLMFAVLNCAPSAIGTGLKTSLENYLLGGAALIMFDEGFTFGSSYVKQMQHELQKMDFTGPKTLTLYYLNQVYVPGSYILYNIQESLKEFYNNLPAEKQKTKKRNRVVITNNATPDNIVHGETLQETFTMTAQAVEKNIKIQFLFMAGMLDILSNLQKTFSQPK